MTLPSSYPALSDRHEWVALRRARLEAWPAYIAPGNPDRGISGIAAHRPRALSTQFMKWVPPKHPLREWNAAPHLPRGGQGPRVSVRRTGVVANSKRDGWCIGTADMRAEKEGVAAFAPTTRAFYSLGPRFRCRGRGLVYGEGVCIARNQIEQFRNPRKKTIQLHRGLRTHPPPHPARHPHRHPTRPDHPPHRLPTLDAPPAQPPEERTTPHGRRDLRHRNRHVMQAHDRAGLPLHARQLFRIRVLVVVVVRVC